MSAKEFLGAALASALETRLAAPEDVVRHATPELLAAKLPRPLWTRLLAAALGAARVDAALIVETITIPELCEHVPLDVLWTCLAEVAARALGHAPLGIATPPPASPVAASPSSTAAPAAIAAPAASGAKSPATPAAPTVATESPSRARTPTSQRLRQSGTTGAPATAAAAGSTSTGSSGAASSSAAPASATPASTAPASTAPASATPGSATPGSAAPTAAAGSAVSATQRRPQATASPDGGLSHAPTHAPPPPPPAPSGRRASTEVQTFDAETEVGADDWKHALAVDLAVDDEQLVDWSSSEDPPRR